MGRRLFDPGSGCTRITTHRHLGRTQAAVSSDGEASDSKTSREEQIEGVFRILSEMLADLKDKGLYDQATIIVTADHGDTNIAEHPLFMVKRSGDTSAYSESEVPASLFDVAIFLAGLADTKLPGQNYGAEIESLTERFLDK